MLRRFLGAAGVLLLLAAASWLPAGVVQTASRTAAPAEPATVPPPIDLGRPSLEIPAAIPARAPSALAAARSFFFTLAWASNVEGQRIGGGEAPYAAAYDYLDPAWRARMPFAKFVEGWKDVAHLDLLQAVDAGPVPHDPRARRVWVEVREYLVLPQGQVVAFADGLFVARSGAQGWLLTEGGLKREDVVSAAFGGTDTRTDPAVAARAFAAAGTRAATTAGGVQREGNLAAVTVTVAAQPGVPRRVVRVRLVRRVDGTWVPLYAQRVG